ncbi:MAG: hypothetical protein WBC04_00215 [Candidatus Acidiferrales bacterium]
MRRRSKEDGIMLRIPSSSFLALAAFVFFAMAPVSDQESAKSSGEVSGTFVSANFDFDHADLSTPANATTFAGSDSRFGKIAGQYLGEFAPAPDGGTCTPVAWPEQGTSLLC